MASGVLSRESSFKCAVFKSEAGEMCPAKSGKRVFVPLSKNMKAAEDIFVLLKLIKINTYPQ